MRLIVTGVKRIEDVTVIEGAENFVDVTFQVTGRVVMDSDDNKHALTSGDVLETVWVPRSRA